MKPRWKSVVELLVALAMVYVGAQLFLDSVHGMLLFDGLPAWLGVVLGLLIMWPSLDLVKNAWKAL